MNLIEDHIAQYTKQLEQATEQVLLLKGAIQALKHLKAETPKNKSLDTATDPAREGKEL